MSLSQETDPDIKVWILLGRGEVQDKPDSSLTEDREIITLASKSRFYFIGHVFRKIKKISLVSSLKISMGKDF